MRLTAALQLLALLAAAAAAGEGRPENGAGESDGEPGLYRYGYTLGAFVDVDKRDAKVAMEVWVRNMLDREKSKDILLATAYESEDELENAIRDGKVHLGVLTVARFLRVRDRLQIRPGPMGIGNGAGEQLLLVHKQSAISDLKGLAGKRLLTEPLPRCEVARKWLELSLAEAGLPAPEKFFDELKESPRVSGVVLPVFFRQVDACLVPGDAFATLVELNPQLGRQLVTVARSPQLVPMMVFYSKQCGPERAARIDRFLTDMHKSPEGQQVLTLFRTSRMVPYDPKALVPTEELFAKLKKLHEQRGTGGEAPAAGEAPAPPPDGAPPEPCPSRGDGA